MLIELNEVQKYKIIAYKTKRLGAFTNKKSSPIPLERIFSNQLRLINIRSSQS
jgi:hypothetical protein